MSTSPLPSTRPGEQGVAAAGISAFLDALEAAPQIDPHSLILLRHGSVVAQGWWAPYSPERRHLLYSLSKSVTMTAAALAIAEGRFALDDTVLSHFPELDGDITDPRSRAMLVRHVASMASGHRDETVDRALALDPDDLVRGFLLIPPDEEPGTRFAYNQPCTYSLAAIVQRTTGQSLTQYLRPRLFDPLGIGEVAWLQDRSGREIGFSGLHATTDAIARLGQLYLQDGVWQGRRLLPQGWVAQASTAHVSTAVRTDGGPDWLQGYGFQFWMSRHGYRGDGAYGQFCVVLPEQHVVLAMTAATEDMQAILDAAWQHLLPACGDRPLTGPDDVAAEERLSHRLAHLALPGVEAAEPDPADDGLRVTVTGPGPLTALELHRDGPGGWSVTLDDAGACYRVGLGGADWSVGEPAAPDGGLVPIATSGGRTPEGGLQVDVMFLETPHRLRLVAGPGARVMSQQWLTTPLHAGRIADLRATARY